MPALSLMQFAEELITDQREQQTGDDGYFLFYTPYFRPCSLRVGARNRSYKKDDEPLLNFKGYMSSCSREKVLLCTKRGNQSPLSKYRGLLDEQNKGEEENVYYQGKCGKLTEHLLSTFSAPSQAPSLLYDFRFRVECPPPTNLPTPLELCSPLPSQTTSHNYLYSNPSPLSPSLWWRELISES